MSSEKYWKFISRNNFAIKSGHKWHAKQLQHSTLAKSIATKRRAALSCCHQAACLGYLTAAHRSRLNGAIYRSWLPRFIGLAYCSHILIAIIVATLLRLRLITFNVLQRRQNGVVARGCFDWQLRTLNVFIINSINIGTLQ